MALSRRAFVRNAGVGGAGLFLARRAWPAGTVRPNPAAGTGRPLLLHNNENPVGPGETVLRSLRAALGDTRAGRYPFAQIQALNKAIAQRYDAPVDSVVTGCGSTEILRTALQVFTSPSRPLVAGIPTYEAPSAYAELIGTPVRAVLVDATLRLDLAKMAEAAKGAGMVYLNNPNNPTATLLGAKAVSEFIDQVLRASPETTILIDEAYHDYVTDPSHATQIGAALTNPRVVVTRTFSKAHGMAGLRIGYAIGHPETMKRLATWQGNLETNAAGVLSAIVSIKDLPRIEGERTRNTEARRFTLDFFQKAGYQATDSQANFIFVNLRRPAKEFREACKDQGVLVGRDFPPFERTHSRVSVGTLEEMHTAARVFSRILSARA